MDLSVVDTVLDYGDQALLLQFDSTTDVLAALHLLHCCSEYQSPAVICG